MKSKTDEITDDFLVQLKVNLACRRVEEGIALLESRCVLFDTFDPQQKNAGVFAGYLAQWVDLGFERPELVKRIVARFSKGVRARLPLPDYLYLRMAEGMIAMAEESKQDAIRHFDLVLELAGEIQDAELV